ANQVALGMQLGEIDHVAVAPPEADAPAGDRADLFRQQAQDRVCGHTLAAARLAHQAKRLATPNVEAHTIDCAYHAIHGAELDLEILDLQQRVGIHSVYLPTLTR